MSLKQRTKINATSFPITPFGVGADERHLWRLQASASKAMEDARRAELRLAIANAANSCLSIANQLTNNRQLPRASARRMKLLNEMSRGRVVDSLLTEDAAQLLIRSLSELTEEFRAISRHHQLIASMVESLPMESDKEAA